jgi:hypothetical protein
LGQVRELSGFSLSVDAAELMRLAGYGTRAGTPGERRLATVETPESQAFRAPEGQLKALMAEVTSEAEELARPRAVYSLFESNDIPKNTFLHSFFAPNEIQDKVGGTNKKVTPAAAAGPPATALVLALCTIGPLLEERVTEYSASGKLSRGLILDLAGSVLAEAACDYVNQEICSEASRLSLFPACRTSPGYGKWRIEEQEVIFRLLPGSSIGVTLTSSFMMIPRKSVSFAVSFLEERPSGEPSSPCSHCNRQDCEFRR